MSRARDILSGLAAESTMTTNVPMATDGKPTVIPGMDPNGGKAREKRKLRFRRRQVHEDGRSLIPDNAQQVSSGQADLDSHPGINGMNSRKPKENLPGEPLIPTSLALVAPDTTPGGESPLDPSQVPNPIQSQATPPDAPKPPENAGGQSLMRNLLGIHNTGFKPDMASQAAPSVDVTKEIVEQAESAMADIVAKEKAQRAISEAMSSEKMPAPKINPNAAAKASAAMRSVLGQ